MKRVDQLLVAAVLMVVSVSAPAYDLLTHEEMSRRAIQRSMVAGPQSDVVRAIGLNGSETFLNGRGVRRTIAALIEDGSAFEDNNVRAINHFYDPVGGAGLVPLIANPSPDWALEDKRPVAFQSYSFTDARNYLYKALTSTFKAERDSNFGLMFETVGHVIHHLQDMAQPQHARLDSHLKITEADSPDWFFENRSRYELYTEARENNLPFDPDPRYAWALSQLPPVSNAREFWVRGIRGGMALFTNKNFVSAGTNFMVDRALVAPNARYQEPAPTFLSDPVSVKQLYADAGKPYPAKLQAECEDKGRDCRMAFVATTIQETDPNFSGINDRAATYSIFDQDLNLYDAKVTYVDADTGQRVVAGRAFSLNEFNFDEAHKFLIPRAVAYSAAMIDYFFRGDIRVGRDPAFPNSAVPTLLNYTKEPISGTVKIYYEKNDGTRAELRTTVVSLPAAGPSGPTRGSAVSFNEPEPFQDAKRPLHYMLVFTGDMGEERRTQLNPIGAVAGRSLSVAYSAPIVSDFRYLSAVGILGSATDTLVATEQEAIDAAEQKLREYLRTRFDPVFNCQAFTMIPSDWPAVPEQTMWGLESRNSRTIRIVFPQSCAGMNGQADITIIRGRSFPCPVDHFRTVRPPFGGESFEEGCYTLTSP